VPTDIRRRPSSDQKCRTVANIEMAIYGDCATISNLPSVHAPEKPTLHSAWHWRPSRLSGFHVDGGLYVPSDV
jgi:hypothetical protein